MSHKRELRYLPAKELRVATNSDGTRTLTGYAIVFNSRSNKIAGSFFEVVSPNAVTDTLRSNSDVRMLRDHDPAILLGRTSSGTLKISADNSGVFFRCDLPDTSQANDVATLVERRDLRGCSFSFNCLQDSWAKDSSGQLIRTLEKINVSEISVVSEPAYPETAVSVRSCPAEYRSLLRSKPSEEEDDEDDDDECECECDACQAGDCDDCTDPDFDHDEDRSKPLTAIARSMMQARIQIARRKY